MDQRLKIAVAQLASIDGAVSDNLRTADRYLADAAGAGADLVLFPEFMSCGYDMSTGIWDCAETRDGPTTRWLREACARHRIWAGTTILETDGRHMLNTFVLADPSGEVAGRVHKAFPAAAEAYRFRGAPGSHVIETPRGRIGIGICYESLFRSWAEEMIQARPDLVLLSFSGPIPSESRFNPPDNGQAFVRLLERAPGVIARLVGVPVAYANKVGPWKTAMPWPLPNEDSRFPGSSRITDGEGKSLAELADQPGLAVADVEPGKPGRPAVSLPRRGRWNQPVPGFFALFRLPELLGRVSYGLSRKRRRAAASAASEDC